jgi:hypothetical protein
MLERFVCHHRAEIGATDSDINNVTNALTGVAFPRAVPDTVGEVPHPIEHGVNLRHDVLAVNDDGGAPGRAQGYMQNCSVLSDIDLLSPEHGLDPLSKARLFGELDEEVACFTGDSILGVIQKEPRSFGGHPLTALRVLRKELPEVQLLNPIVVGL